MMQFSLPWARRVAPSRIPLPATAVLLLLLAPSAHAAGGDLQADWSDTTNGLNGWSYNAGGAPTVNHVANWAGTNDGSPAWVFGTNTTGSFLPAIQKLVGVETPDTAAGDVLLHPWDSANGGPSAVSTTVTWTSNFSGTALISGSVWDAYEAVDRNIEYDLQLNGTSLVGGPQLLVANVDNRAHPTSFALLENLTAGDVLMLTSIKPTGQSFESALDATLNIAPASAAAPEPSSLTLAAIPFVLLAARRLRRRR